MPRHHCWVGIVLLAGCGGSQPPIGAPGAMPQSHVIVQHAARGGPWMLPEAKSDDLLYGASDNGYVYVFSYPKTKEVGELTAIAEPYGTCVDPSGDVWITSISYSEAIEYAHGGTNPIAVLTLPQFFNPIACAVDPTTGNLAVLGSSSAGTSVAIFQRASGTPTVYADQKMWQLNYCTYDDRGNLFIRGFDWKPREQIVEQAKGKQSFFVIHTKAGLAQDGAVQWDGKYLVVQSGNPISGPEPMDRIRIRGGQGAVAGTFQLDVQATFSFPFWVGSSTIAQTTEWGKIGVWHYPAGGRAFNKFRRGFGQFLGIAVSKAPQ